MNRKEQKRTARHILAIRTKHDRLVTAYIRNKYPKVYEEVEQYYQTLNLKYPNKRDLTKTTDFLHFTTGYGSFIDYYRARAEDEKKKKDITQETHTVEDNMSLRIQLMDNDDVNMIKLCEKPDESLPIPEDVYNSLISELAKDPQLYSIFNGMSVDNSQQPLEQQQFDETTREFGLSPEDQQQVDEIVRQLELSQDQQTEVIIPGPVSHQQQQMETNIAGPVSHQQQFDEIIQELDELLPKLFEEEQTLLEKELTHLGY